MSSATRVLSHVVRSRELAVAVVLVALVVVTTLRNDNFLFSPAGWRNLLLNPSMLLILAVGQTAVIITRNVDLSVGSTLGLTAYAVGKLYPDFVDFRDYRLEDEDFLGPNFVACRKARSDLIEFLSARRPAGHPIV